MLSAMFFDYSMCKLSATVTCQIFANFNSLCITIIHTFRFCNYPLGLVRLSNGTDTCSGHVEVYQGDQWGKVCKNHFGLEEARVLCKDLNCGPPKEYKDSFNDGDASLKGYTSRCVGNESSISQCSLQEISGMCEGVSLTCTGKSAKVGAVWH